MTRSVKRFFILVLILLSLITSGVGVTPAYAASSMEIVPLALPAGWLSGHLYEVWGSSAGDVYAVGYGNNGSATAPLLYHYNGTAWSGSGLPVPNGWSSGYMFGVWGSGPNNIYVVGSGYAAGPFLPLLYHFNGISWTAFSPDLPAGWRSGYLYGIWGSSASDIYAVGYGYSGDLSLPLVYHFDGSSWTEAGLSAPAGWGSINLQNVWGSSASDVFVVGYGNNGSITNPVLYHTNASSWSGPWLSAPPGWNSGHLYDAWGAGASDVYLVGYGNNASTTAPLLYNNKAGVWTDASLALPSGWSRGYLYGVWGSSAIDIYTVGSGNRESQLLPLMYHNDGSGWSESSPPLPLGWSFGYLHSVWGSATNDVYVAGTGNNGSTNLPLLYHTSQGGQDLVAPGDVTGFVASTTTTSGSVTLSWTEPSDDAGNNASGPVASYLVKYSTSPFTSWTDGTPVTTGLPAPTAPNTTQTMTVTGLSPNTLYYFAIRAQDDQYNLSANFATTSARTLDRGAWYISTRGNFLFGELGDIPVAADYNGDGLDDIAVYRPSNGTWYISSAGNFVFGEEGDIEVPADYNGDRRDDIAVYRPSNGTWYISTRGNFTFGEAGDIPVPGDYNGDGWADVAVYRPSNGTWYISTLGNFTFGEAGDIPVPGDYNGDRRDDIAVYRPSNGTWYISTRDNVVFGEAGDIPVPGDYDRDGRDDVAVYRPSNGTWYVSTRGNFAFGETGDIPVPGDYNGDGWADIAVFRPSQ